jgi:hypothetical protein
MARGSLGHIETALIVPLGELSGRLTEIRAFRDQPVILDDKTDKRSAVTAATTGETRFCDVGVLRCDMAQWNRDGRLVGNIGTAARSL